MASAVFSISILVFGGESAIVSPLIVSGTHALTLALYGVLRPNDEMIAITGSPYDTLKEVIVGEGNGSLKDFGINYKQIELKDGNIDIPGFFISEPTIISAPT